MSRKISLKKRKQNIKQFYIKALKKISFFLILLLLSNISLAQNSMVGDGFGGRLWYQPYNYLAGGYSAFSICEDSSKLFGWGNNIAGELGISYIPDGTSTPLHGNDLTNIRYCSSSFLSAGAIKNDRTGWVWGYIGGPNYFPRKIISNAKFVRSGLGLCVFVKHDGTVWSVGLNTTGCFGNGTITTNNKYTLTLEQMTGITTAVRVAVSENTTAILLSDGTVWSTGTNIDGSLGNNSITNATALVPVNVIGLKDIIDIKANTRNIIALDKNGDVWVWGTAIGTGILNSKTAYIPKKIPSLKNIVAISGSTPGQHFLALDSNHNCYGWGENAKGQLGDTNIIRFQTPTLIATDVNDINTGTTFSYIIKKDGTLWSIGSSYYGSIWMNHSNVKRGQFTQLTPEDAPFNLCNPAPFKPKTLTSIKVEICSKDSFFIGTRIYKTNGNYRDTLSGSLNSDSIILTQLKTIMPTYYSQNINLCSGLKITIKKKVYSISGIYYDTFINANGCDSILTTNLNISSPSPFIQNVSICSGGKYLIGKNTYTSAGIYTDTIFSYNGCDSIVISKISVSPIPIYTQNISVCEGETYLIGKHQYSKAGSYIDTISNPLGCDSIVYSSIIIYPRPSADFDFLDNPPDMDAVVNFYNMSVGANLYLWQFNLPHNDTSTLMNPNYTFHTAGDKYVQLIVKNSNTTCKDTIVKLLNIKDNSVIYIPSAFSPNGDGLNDFFIPVTKNFDLIHYKVFNRWGEIIFETNNFSPGWDGKYKGVLCIKGIYTYFIEFSSSYNSRKQLVTGIITLE